ncbi:cysteinyl leukotriene receptor 1 [Varanus komodoensis]|uniref:Cysteinyl leukotriene receptor 1 n=1 Tax=Varanus komodoensis TaxID=61221 RepID=A0A8D2JAP5_VARKO|nr:cysteinyl leukotriene receptor 1 [Varanus komodoensis]XP_044283440.1 cysteinyl leukotriene receptor 1 [Varanus komodoensis]XP_044283441.1 cysteinyl leukotriene receptor 1 [Varanus komodoensis]
MDSKNNSSSCTIEEFRSQVYPITYSITCVLGLVGNGFVLLVLIKTYQQKTALQLYMLNLALSDLLFVCTLPLRVVYYLYKGNWFFGDFLCRVSSYTLYVNLYCSIFFMTAMSFFRCVAIVFPIQSIHFITDKKARLVCISIWVFVMLTSSPFLINGSTVDNQTHKTKCFEPPEENELQKLSVLHYIALIVGFILPFVIIAVCYTMIIWTLLKNSWQNRDNSHKKAIWMILIVTMVFLISFTPYHIQRTIHLYTLKNNKSCEERLYMQKSVVITLSLAAFNCCFDPLLYFFAGNNFRKRVSTLRKASAPISPLQQRNVSLKPTETVLAETKVVKERK